MNSPWVESGRLDVGATSLEYKCFGPAPAAAPTLVLLHEGLGCSQLWRDTPASLAGASGLGVFVYSRAGYGQSDSTVLPRPLDYMALEAIDVLPELLDSIGVQRALLIGHSDGATIAAIHAGRVADPRVEGVVLIAPHFFTEAAGLAEIAKARDAFETGDLREKLRKYHRDPDIAFLGWNDAWLNPDFDVCGAVEMLDTISVPVLAVQGRDDPYGTLAQIDVITRRVRHAPVSTLILDECQHAPHLEQGPLVLPAIAAFARQCTGYG